MSEETFERFRSVLKKTVAKAIKRGVRISATPGCNCPISCFGDGTDPRPPASHVRRFLDFTLPPWAPTAFTNGFDGVEEIPGSAETIAYFELGQEYRARFP